MILNTRLYGLAAAFLCVFLLRAAWDMAHQHGDEENIWAVFLALFGAVSGLLAIDWIFWGA